MNHVDYDPDMFEVDEYGNLYPVVEDEETGVQVDDTIKGD